MRTLLIVVLFMAQLVQAAAAPLGDDGLHKEDWFEVTLRDIRDDVAAASAEGKRLAIVFEQRGCGACARMHQVLLADPEVRDYIATHFQVVQYNMFGGEQVTDLDGETLTEKAAARKWGYIYTPTIVFLPDKLGTDAKTTAQAAVYVMRGAPGKSDFLSTFQWIAERAYERGDDLESFRARAAAAEDEKVP